MAREQSAGQTSGDDVTPPAPGGLSTVVDGLPVRSWIAIAAAIAIVVLGFGAWWTFGLDRGAGMQQGMGGDMAGDMGGQMGNGQMPGMAAPGDVPRFPPVAAYYDGERVFFAHTETSDEQISDLLTDMMGSPVLTVPGLARTPEDALSPVYVFTNGITPDGPRGPLGFQADVFATAPGDPGYTPLRQLVKLSWTDSAQPRLLTSADEIEHALGAGELRQERTGVVINAPLLTWPNGKR